MKLIDHATATVDLEFTEGNPGTGTPATRVTAQWLNVLQEEIANVVIGAGDTLDQTGVDRSQLFNAIESLIAANVGAPPTTQYLKSGTAATYTTPAGCTGIRVRMTGAGGGGAGGVGSTAADGGDTSFNSIVAKGGKGGVGGAGTTNAGNGGLGGTGGSGSSLLRIDGNAGMTAGIAGGGNGAPGGFGQGATRGGGYAVPGAQAVANTGAGGGGGYTSNVSNHGGGGGGGGEYVEFYITSPSATYTFTIGAGGAGTVKAGSNQDGASGGSGLIIVEEFY